MDTVVELSEYAGLFFRSRQPVLIAGYTDIDWSQSLVFNQILKVSYASYYGSLWLGILELNVLFLVAEKYRGAVVPVSDLTDPGLVLVRQRSKSTGLTIDSPTEIFDTRTGAFIGAGIIFVHGVCHAAAWNTHFPSPVECCLWSVSSTVTAVTPSYFVVLVPFIWQSH